MNESRDSKEIDIDDEQDIPIEWALDLSEEQIIDLVIKVRKIIDEGGLSISPMAAGHMMEISGSIAEELAFDSKFEPAEIAKAANLFAGIMESFRDGLKDPSKSFGSKYSQRIAFIIETMKQYDLFASLLFRVSRGQSLRDFRIGRMVFAPRSAGVNLDFYKLEFIYRTVNGELSSIAFELERNEVKSIINELSKEIEY